MEDFSQPVSSTNSDSVSIVAFYAPEESLVNLGDSEFPTELTNIIGSYENTIELDDIEVTEKTSVAEDGSPIHEIDDPNFPSWPSCRTSTTIVEDDIAFDESFNAPLVEAERIEFDYLTSNSTAKMGGVLNMASSLTILMLIYWTTRMAVQLLRNWSEIRLCAIADSEMSVEILGRQDQEKEREIADLRSRLEASVSNSIRNISAVRMAEEKACSDLRLLRLKTDEMERMKEENERMLVLIKELTNEKMEMKSAQTVVASQLLCCTAERDRLSSLVVELYKEKENSSQNMKLKNEKVESPRKNRFLFEKTAIENEDDDSDFENFYFTSHAKSAGQNVVHNGPRKNNSNQKNSKLPVVRSATGSFSTVFTDSSSISLRNSSCSSSYSESEGDHNNDYFEDMNELELEDEDEEMENNEDRDFETQYQNAMNNIKEKLAQDLSVADKLVSNIKTPPSLKEKKRDSLVIEHTKMPVLPKIQESAKITHFYTPEKSWKQSSTSAFKYEKKKILNAENGRESPRTYPQERGLIEGHLIGQNKNLMGQICCRDEEIKDSLHRIEVLNTRLEYAVLAAKSANLEVARLKSSSPTAAIESGTLPYDVIPTPNNKDIDMRNLFSREELLASQQGMMASRVFSPLDDIPPHASNPCTPSHPLYLYLACASTTPSAVRKSAFDSPIQSLRGSSVCSAGDNCLLLNDNYSTACRYLMLSMTCWYITTHRVLYICTNLSHSLSHSFSLFALTLTSLLPTPSPLTTPRHFNPLFL